MLLENGIKISNTNGTRDNANFVRVHANGEKIAEVKVPRRNPFGYLQQYGRSKYRTQLLYQVKQAEQAGKITEEDYKRILEVFNV